VTIKGLAYVTRKRPGRPILHYVYAWRGGPCILRKEGGTRPKLTPEAVAAYHEAVRTSRRAPGGTLAAHAGDWRASPEWAAYSKDTRKQWGAKLSLIQEKWGAVPLEVFDDHRMRDKVVAFRDSLKASPRGADMAIQVLRALLAYGMMRGRLNSNVARGISQLYKGGNRAAIVWDPTERYVMELGLTTPVADAFRLACLTGLRRTDLCELPRSAVGEHAIVWATSKSGRTRTVTVPMIAPLRALVAELGQRPRRPGVSTLLVNSRGVSWTPDGLDSSFGDERDRIGFDKHLHDCKGTYVTELCLAGLTNEEIAGIVGWTVNQVADIRRIYVDQERITRSIGERIANWEKSLGQPDE
jgi:hypothetical protein